MKRDPWLVKRRERVGGICLNWGGVAVVGSYLQGWGSQEGSGPSAFTVTFHTKVLSHAVLGEMRSFRETKEVVRGEIYSRWGVMWTGIQAGLPALKASSVSRDHTAGKMCDLQKTLQVGSLVSIGSCI